MFAGWVKGGKTSHVLNVRLEDFKFIVWDILTRNKMTINMKFTSRTAHYKNRTFSLTRMIDTDSCKYFYIKDLRILEVRRPELNAWSLSKL